MEDPKEDPKEDKKEDKKEDRGEYEMQYPFPGSRRLLPYTPLLAPQALEDLYIKEGTAKEPARLAPGGERTFNIWDPEPSVPCKNIDLPEDTTDCTSFTLHVVIPRHQGTQRTRVRLLLRLESFLEDQRLGMEAEREFFFDGPWYILTVRCKFWLSPSHSTEVRFSRLMLLQMAEGWKQIVDDAGLDGALSFIRARGDWKNIYTIVPPREEEILTELHFLRVRMRGAPQSTPTYHPDSPPDSPPSTPPEDTVWA